jgi:hypothetical protein
MPDETQEQSKQPATETPSEGAAPEESGSTEPRSEPGENEPEHPAGD